MTVPVGPESLSFGPQDAPVTIVEFSDFQCPHCRFGAQRLESLLKRFPKQLRVVMKSYPLDPSCNRLAQGGGHRKACEAAKVAYCAKAQGKLKEVYAALFENQESMEAKGPQAIAIEAGLDAGQLSQCLNSAATSDLVLKDIEAGSQYNIQGTPTFFINGRKVEAPLTVSAWTQLIEQLLKSSNR
jgi:protein-disulfide isomerase